MLISGKKAAHKYCMCVCVCPLPPSLSRHMCPIYELQTTHPVK